MRNSEKGSGMALLEIKSLTHYFSGLCALSSFALSLEAQGIHGLIGPNGAGKTTVFNLISGVYRPTSGSIRLGGRELVGLSSDRIAAFGVSRTFQNIRLFKQATVLDNIRTACYCRTGYAPADALFHTRRYRAEEERIFDKAQELLRLFNLADSAGISSGFLPYGKQRRLEIARALATDPAVLLLDEPAAGMNPNEVGELMGLIAELPKRFKVSVLLIEHQMRLVMGICSKVTVLDFGVTLAEGSPGEIQNDPKVLKAYLGEKI